MTLLNDPSRSAFGYSWHKDPAPLRDDPRDPRLRVCPPCRRSTDPVTVRIVALAPRESDRPTCYRCGVRLGRTTVSYD